MVETESMLHGPTILNCGIVACSISDFSFMSDSPHSPGHHQMTTAPSMNVKR